MELSLKSLILTTAMLAAQDSKCMEIMDHADASKNKIEESYSNIEFLMNSMLVINTDTLKNQSNSNSLVFEKFSTEILSALENIVLIQKQMAEALNNYATDVKNADVAKVYTNLIHENNELKKCYEEYRVPLCIKAIVFAGILKGLCSQSKSINNEILDKMCEIEMAILPLERDSTLHLVDLHYKNVIGVLNDLNIMYARKMLDNLKELVKALPNLFMEISTEEVLSMNW